MNHIQQKAQLFSPWQNNTSENSRNTFLQYTRTIQKNQSIRIKQNQLQEQFIQRKSIRVGKRYNQQSQINKIKIKRSQKSLQLIDHDQNSSKNQVFLSRAMSNRKKEINNSINLAKKVLITQDRKNFDKDSQSKKDASKTIHISQPKRLKQRINFPLIQSIPYCYRAIPFQQQIKISKHQYISPIQKKLKTLVKSNSKQIQQIFIQSYKNRLNKNKSLLSSVQIKRNIVDYYFA